MSEDSASSKYEKVQKLELDQVVNKVVYSCKTCEESWPDLEFIEEFEDRDIRIPSVEFERVLTTIVRNKFRAPGTEMYTICPKCADEESRGEGQIDVRIADQSEDNVVMQYFAKNHPYAIEKALHRERSNGLKLNSRGKVVKDE